MIPVDLHTHSLFSNCGVHTIIEMLTRARERGMAGIAITDHGPILAGRVSGTFFDRLVDPVPGVRLLKGMECNLDGDAGAIDLPEHLRRFCDVVLLGVHPNTPQSQDRAANTNLLITAMKRNPAIDIITHPNSTEYPFDFVRLARESARLGVALELNNSKTALKRTSDEMTEELIAACVQECCPVAVCSDAHVVNEVGCDDAVRPLMARAGLAESQVVNSTAASALAWVESRRAAKLSPR